MTELRPDGPGTVGFLHTAQVHVATFESLSRELLRTVRTVHRVDPEALELARQGGTGDRVRAVVGGHLSELREAGCEVILCTCSTIGEVAEALSGGGFEVIRIDRPMLRRAVALGQRIGVVAALASTVEPTTRVLAQEAADAGAAISLEVSVVDGGVGCLPPRRCGGLPFLYRTGGAHALKPMRRRRARPGEHGTCCRPPGRARNPGPDEPKLRDRSDGSGRPVPSAGRLRIAVGGGG
jgi:hypothetical protein